jgi:hypothetical protein
MIKASDEELEKSIESCERWEWFGGGLVFFGVAAAVAIAAIHPKYDSFLEQWGSAIADGLVAVGVAIEIKFGQMAGLRQSELRRRSDDKVAEANERATKAQLELAKYRAWRRLEKSAFASVVETMTPFAGTPYTLAVSILEPEISELMFQIDLALKVARLEHQGWPQTRVVRFPTGDNAVSPGIGVGVNVRDVTITWELEPGVPPTLARIGQALSTALNSVGIVAGAYGEKQMPMTRPNPTLRVMIRRKT